MNSILKTSLKAVLSILPVQSLLKYILSLFKEQIEKSENKIDDKVYEVLNTLIENIDFGIGGIAFSEQMQKFFDVIKNIIAKYSYDDVINLILEYLHEAAKKTETNFDDDLVDLLEATLKHFGVIK